MERTEMASVLRDALTSAPPHIQTFITSGKFEVFMATLQSSLGLHVDTADKVSNELLMMLLGMTTPEELPGNLGTEAGVPEETIGRILDATNKEIFVPLRNETLAAGRTPAAESAPVRETTPPVQATPTPALDLAGRPVPRESAPIMVSTPAYVPPAPPVAVPTPQAAVIPPMRTMAHDIEAMKNGEVGHTAPVVPLTSAPVTAPAPVIPVPEPISTPAPVATPIAPRPQPAAPTTPNVEALSQTLKKYGIDPYREPPE